MMQNILVSLLVNAAVFTVLFGLLLVVRKLMGNRISAVMQYALWVVVVVKLVIPFGFESRLSPIGWLAGAGNAAAAEIQTDADAAYMPTEQDDSAAPAVVDTAMDTSQSAALPASVGAALQAETVAADTTSPVAIEIDWASAIFGLWAAGLLTAGGFMVRDAARMRHRIRRDAMPPSPRVLRILDACRKELGLRIHVNAVVQSAMNVPFVMNAVRPELVLPSDTEAMDDAQIRHIIMHELTHVKYGDLIVIIILNLLSAVYWFNPLTWLCFRQIRKDMEVVCDCRVIIKLGLHVRRDYIGTVLQFASREEQHHQYAAMGMADGRVTMEQRIRGMFKAVRTGAGSRVLVLGLAVLMLATGVLTACQPTPETPPVVNKADGHLEDMIADSAQATPAVTDASQSDAERMAALKSTVGAPDAYQDSYTNTKGDVTVTIDANIAVPAVENIPAYEVALGGFPQEMIDTFAVYFLGDVPVYTEEYVQTKDEIMEQIVNCRRDIEMAEEYDITNKEQEIARMQNKITELQAEYENAPEQRPRTPSTTALVDDDNGNGQNVNVVADLGKDAAASFQAYNYNDNDYYVSQFSFVDDGKGFYDDMSFASGTLDGLPRGMKMTQEDAQQAVMQCLDDLGICDMQVAGVSASTFMRDHNDYNDEEYLESANQCYMFTLTRVLGGVAVSHVEPSVQLDSDDPDAVYPEEPDYSVRVDPESMVIWVDDTGIVRFEWTNPAEITSVLSEHVTLMPFDQVVARAKDNMFYKVYTAYDSQENIKISNVTLSMMRVMKKDAPGTFMMVPVWDFIGTSTSIFDGESYESSFGDLSYVTINAIDGSSISRDWGY